MRPRCVDLLSGIGGIRLAFQRTGSEFVFACEKEEDARRVYEMNFDHEVDATDLRTLPPVDIPEHDILLAGWPCPSFSIIGDKEGLEDARGNLIFDIVEVLEEQQPAAFLLENVKNVTTMKDRRVFEIIRQELESAGYSLEWEVLNALNFGLPQRRERLIIVGFRDPPTDFSIPTEYRPLETPAERRASLEDVIVDDPSERYMASEQIREARREAVDAPDECPEPSVWHENRSQNISVNPYSCALRANASWNYLLINGQRHLTPRELLRLQGFPDWYEIPTGSYSRVRKLTGKTVPVSVVEAVAKEMIDCLDLASQA